MAWIKRGLIFLVVLFALLAGVIAWLLSGLDANQYKSKIEQLAAEQGIALSLDGDIGWQLWPNIALKLEGVKLAPLPLPDQPLLRADKIAVGVALMPLLKKRIEAQEILLLGPQIELSVDEKGKGNWELITEAMEARAKQDASTPPKLDVPKETPKTAEASETASEGLHLALEKLRIEDGRLSYKDAAAKTAYSVDQLHVAADNLVPGGKPGEVELSAQLQGSSLQQPVTINMRSDLAIDDQLNGLRLQPATIKFASGDAAAEINLRGHVRRDNANQPWQIKMHLGAEAEPLAPWLAVVGSEVVTQSSDALQKLRLETDIAGSEKALTLEPLQLELDSTVFTGNAKFNNGDIPALDLVLRGNQFVLDDYLPPPTDSDTEQAATPAEVVKAVPVELPLESMRGFNAKLALSLDKLQAMDLEIGKPQIELNVNNGLFQLTKLAAGLYGGELNTTGQFNARGKSARAEVTGGLTGVEISKVQQALFANEKVSLSGKTDLTWAAQTGGADTVQLQKQLRAAVQLSSAELALAPFNLEKGMCQLVSYAEKTPLPEQEWPARTRLQDLRANINLNGDLAKVQQINAGIENIALTGDGEIDLEKQQFDFALGLALVGNKTSANGCSVQNERWRDRPLPLRCKDKFDDAGAGSCKPDSRRLDDLIRDELKYKAEKKYGDKAKKKVDELKDKFKGLFDR